jgi:hypothetical protein
MKMELIESSETSANNTQTPGTYPKESKLHLKHGENLKSRLPSTLIADYKIEKKNAFLSIRMEQLGSHWKDFREI